MMSTLISVEKFGNKMTVTSSGAEAVSFLLHGREVMWCADPAVWKRRAPFLFPVCCAAKDNEIIIEEKTYPMSKHGFAQASEWKAEVLQDDKIVMTLEPNEISKSMYPFAFRLTVTYTILEDGYDTTISVENRDERPMPYCIGAHPGIVLPMSDQWKYEDYKLIFAEKEEAHIMALVPGGYVDGFQPIPELKDGQSLPISHDLIDHYDTLIFRDLNSRSADLVAPDGHGLRLRFADFPVLGLWSAAGKNAPYLCLEPWNGLPYGIGEDNVLANKPYAVTIAPGERKTYSYQIQAI